MLGFIAAAAAGTFTLYPGPAYRGAEIEAVIQRGAIYELIVNCSEGTAIMSFSPAEGLYCAPAGGCSTSRHAMIAASCGREPSLD